MIFLPWPELGIKVRLNVVWLLVLTLALAYLSQWTDVMPYQFAHFAAARDMPLQNWIFHIAFHDDVLSFAVNIVFLLLVGTSVHSILGDVAFLALFLASGMTTVLAVLFFMPQNPPLLGATGAMAGVMGFWFYRHFGQSCLYLWLTPVLPFRAFNKKDHFPSFIAIVVWLLPAGVESYLRPDAPNKWPMYLFGFLFGLLFALVYSFVESTKIE